MSSKFKKSLLLILLLVVLAVIVIFYLWQKPTIPSSSKTNKTVTSSNTDQQTSDNFNTGQLSTSDPSSIWVVVNKPHALNPINFVPKNLMYPDVPLRVPGNESMQVGSDTAKELKAMFADAKLSGLTLMLSSGYRSYAYQVNLYNGYVKSIGQSAADQQSARPGHSEHQTGLAVDIEPSSRKCELDACFASTPEGKWLAANAYKYGFILRYPADKVAVTGYEFEPWHYRYVGIDLAIQMHNQKVETLEEFFNVSGGSAY